MRKTAAALALGAVLGFGAPASATQTDEPAVEHDNRGDDNDNGEWGLLGLLGLAGLAGLRRRDRHDDHNVTPGDTSGMPRKF